MNRLYYGDNRHVLRDTQAFPDASVDLIYLDPPAWPKPLRRGEGPPFNSKRDDNLLFKSPKTVAAAVSAAVGKQAALGTSASTPFSEAQIASNC